MPELEPLEEFANLAMAAARPLVWLDVREPWPKRLHGGSCFILRFDGGLIGVTADHVISAFKRTQRERGSDVAALLRTVPFDLAGAIIDRSEKLDIATFRVTEEQLIDSKAIAIDCRMEWPPPTPDPERELSASGFPEALKTADAPDNVRFNAYVHLARVEHTTEQDIWAIYDPERGDRRARSSAELSDLGANLSGCSGGPVLMHVLREGSHRWFAVGLIVEGPGETSDAEARKYDTFRFRRVHFVGKDGSISWKDQGWLPS